MKPIVSAIVTTKNEQKHISNCLESIKKQNYSQDKIEIIVVDNNSTDRTKEIAKEYTNKVYDYGPERSAQRNHGVRQASGEYILYLDADMILSKDVIKECVEKCENISIIALYIPERIVDFANNNINNLSNLDFNLCLPRRSEATLRGNQRFWIRVRDFERSFYNATCIDAVRFIKKDKFLEIGGFDESLTGPEDWDFDRRIKNTGSVTIINSPIYHNEGELSLKNYLRKKYYYTVSFSKYVEKWGKDDKIIKKQLGFFYRFFWVFCEKENIYKILAHPLLFSEMYFLKILVGMVYLFKICPKCDKIFKS